MRAIYKNNRDISHIMKRSAKVIKQTLRNFLKTELFYAKEATIEAIYVLRYKEEKEEVHTGFKLKSL